MRPLVSHEFFFSLFSFSYGKCSMEANAQHKCVFSQRKPRVGKVCGTSDKTPATQKNCKKSEKNLGFRGKVLEVTSPKSSECLLLFFVFLIFQTISQTCFEVIPCGLFKPDFAQTAPFPQRFAGAAPHHVCHLF